LYVFVSTEGTKASYKQCNYIKTSTPYFQFETGYLLFLLELR